MSGSRNVFHGEYKEPLGHHIFGCLGENEFQALDPDIRGIIGAVGRGSMDEKKFRCKDERHPLKAAYDEGMVIADQQITNQLSDERLLKDLSLYLDELFGQGSRPEKEQLRVNFFQSIGKDLRSTRNKIAMVFHESLMNVIEHGMRHDPRKPGFINIGMNTEGKFDIVAYGGREFDYAKTIAAAEAEAEAVAAAQAEAEDKQNCPKPRVSGRGLVMIKNCADRKKFAVQQYSKKGTYLLVQFFIREQLLGALFNEVQKLGLGITLKSATDAPRQDQES